LELIELPLGQFRQGTQVAERAYARKSCIVGLA
jgi:hypothetical protein